VSCAKAAELQEMPFGTSTLVGQRKHVLDRGAHWRNLANAIELSMCDDAAFSSNYLDLVNVRNTQIR